MKTKKYILYAFEVIFWIQKPKQLKSCITKKDGIK